MTGVSPETGVADELYGRPIEPAIEASQRRAARRDAGLAATLYGNTKN